MRPTRVRVQSCFENDRLLLTGEAVFLLYSAFGTFVFGLTSSNSLFLKPGAPL